MVALKLEATKGLSRNCSSTSNWSHLRLLLTMSAKLDRENIYGPKTFTPLAASWLIVRSIRKACHTQTISTRRLWLGT
jgi:hypothetical protein